MTQLGNQAPLAILGAGSWGTALALYLARRGQIVRVWSIDPTEITAMLADKANNRYIPGVPLPDTLQPTLLLDKTVEGVRDILVVVPSFGFRQTLALVEPYLTPESRIICASKGLDTETGNLLSEVMHDVLGANYPFAVLSGPSFAKEVANGLPTAVVIASKNKTFRRDLVDRFDSDIFRIHESEDIIGVELGGVVKNVIAIATGLSDGLKFGTNLRSAIITLGLHEIMALGMAMGADPNTFIGLSGLGDLILTCSDNQSRNRQMGLLLGEGLTVDRAEEKIGQVVEGKRSADLVTKLAARYKVNMPICQLVNNLLLSSSASEATAVTDLTSSPQLKERLLNALLALAIE